ncbi:MAG: type II toxin-antitoxin system Phd/YefM family antitoxin [Erysipelotrichaceae bacterium]|nr:type II toxin-antitoxin system Phd/YefM family antitoxin [Erysipelotrichaceae bacterium]
MTIVKQMDIRDNIKKYFDMAHEGEPIIVPRKNDKNVVIISENDYKEFEKYKRNAEYIAMLEKSMQQAREGGFIETTIKQLESFE